MPVRIHTAGTIGLNGQMICVETDITPGMPTCTIVGLPDAAVLESRERVRSAIKNSGFTFPPTRKVISLAPADIRKHGPAFDLPIAISILAASGQIQTPSDDTLFFGELSLSGEIRAIPGIIPLLLFLKKTQQKTPYREIFIPEGNSEDAMMVEGENIIPVGTLSEVVAHIRGDAKKKFVIPESMKSSELQKSQSENSQAKQNALLTIRGQEKAKRGITLAAAGHHHILLSGPPGIGKTLLAHAMKDILPPPSHEEFLEIAAIHSLKTAAAVSMYRYQRPIREVHHTATIPSILGGGGSLTPGEVSLAHRGVLILDELAEFSHQMIESLRQPLEEGHIHLARASGRVTYPAKFLLFATTNPCPCGYLGQSKKRCTCSQYQIAQYQKRISEPIYDRIDIRVQMDPVAYHEMIKMRKNTAAAQDTQELDTSRELDSQYTSDASDSNPENTKNILDSIQIAREKQRKRYEGTQFITNSELTADAIDRFCKLSTEAEETLFDAAKSFSFSGRAIHRTIKLARTIADLEQIQKSPQLDIIQSSHIAQALQFK